jgi:2'-5' RNA ligase
MRNMPEQLCFSGFEHRPARDNLFFGLVWQEQAALEINKAAADLRRLLGLLGRPIEPERLHVSLQPVGRYDGLPNFVVERARQAGGMVSASICPFALVFDRIMSFDNRREKRPVVLRPGYDLVRLFALHDILGQAMKRARIGRHAVSHFTPHMTLLYDNRTVRERPIEPIRMNVLDLVLVHSLVGQSRYIELARWPLRG